MIEIRLRPSNAHRWSRCPASAQKEAEYTDDLSPYKNEGQIAHTIIKDILRDGCSSISPVSEEMEKAIDYYIDTIKQFREHSTYVVFEEKLDLSFLIPNGHGTPDAIIMDPQKRVCHIFDFKYGAGVVVHARWNIQCLLYAIGFLDKVNYTTSIQTFTIHIIQPRRNIYDVWHIDVRDLLDFSDTIKKAVSVALSDNPPFVPGTIQCRFCKAKADCGALANYTMNTIPEKITRGEVSTDVAMNTLTIEQKVEIFESRHLIKNFLYAIERHLTELVRKGVEVPGYGMVVSNGKTGWLPEALKVAGEILTEEEMRSVTRVEMDTITKAKRFLTSEKLDKLTEKRLGTEKLYKRKDDDNIIQL